MHLAEVRLQVLATELLEEGMGEVLDPEEHVRVSEPCSSATTTITHNSTPPHGSPVSSIDRRLRAAKLYTLSQMSKLDWMSRTPVPDAFAAMSDRMMSAFPPGFSDVASSERTFCTVEGARKSPFSVRTPGIGTIGSKSTATIVPRPLSVCSSSSMLRGS